MPRPDQDAAVSAILFDLGGVLVDVDERSAVHELARVAELDLPTADAMLFGSPGKRALDRGTITPYAHYRSWPAEARARVDYGRFLSIWNGLFCPKNEVIALAHELAERFPLYLLSNTDLAHFSLIAARYPFMRLFRRTFLSFELGCAKPDARIYERVAAELPGDCDELLFIDDKSKNVAAAVTSGWQAVRFTSAETLRLDLRALGIERA
ncbi:MAG: HAD family phosphatase [Myxococcales bacterium]|nr:HAD family phosphatase [Myxococcales bacterium]